MTPNPVGRIRGRNRAPTPPRSARRGRPTRLARPAACLLAVLLLTPLWTGCAGKRVSRIDPESVTDLSGRWNDTDSRLVAKALIEQSLESGWADRHARNDGGEPPVVIVGSFRNRTLEHVPISTFVNDIERALLNSGKVRIVAGGEARDEARAEREDQQEHARSDTRAQLGRELGADYILQGELVSIEDEEGGEKVVYYQVDATLVDLESNAHVWAGQHRIKKLIERSRLGL